MHKVICVACHRAQHIFSGTVDGQYSASLLFVLWRRPLTQTTHRPRHPTSSRQHVRDQHEFKRIPFSNPFDSMLCFFFDAPLWTHLASAECLSNRCPPILNLKVGGVGVLVVASAAVACPEQVVQNTVHQPSRKSMCYKEFALSRTVSPCAHAHFFVCRSTCTA